SERRDDWIPWFSYGWHEFLRTDPVRQHRHEGDRLLLRYMAFLCGWVRTGGCGRQGGCEDALCLAGEGRRDGWAPRPMRAALQLSFPEGARAPALYPGWEEAVIYKR